MHFVPGFGTTLTEKPELMQKVNLQLAKLTVAEDVLVALYAGHKRPDVGDKVGFKVGDGIGAIDGRDEVGKQVGDDDGA